MKAKVIMLDANEALSLISYLPGWQVVLISRQPFAPLVDAGAVVAPARLMGEASMIAQLLDATVRTQEQFYENAEYYDIDELYIVSVEKDSSMKLIKLSRI